MLPARKTNIENTSLDKDFKHMNINKLISTIFAALLLSSIAHAQYDSTSLAAAIRANPNTVHLVD